MFIFNKIIAVRMDILFAVNFARVMCSTKEVLDASPTHAHKQPLIPLSFATLVKNTDIKRTNEYYAFLLFHLHSMEYNNVFGI